jgi:uncharacterized UPF0160 family protein
MKKLDLTYANKGLEVRTMAVHDMTFHADDVFAAMLIRSIYPEVEILRTRDIDTLKKTDVVADVGFIYNAETLRFDHHQEGRAGARENGILYSAIGLIWKHWGIEICEGNDDLFEYIDRILIQPIDAQDNSQKLYENQIYEGISDLNLDGIMRKGFNPAVNTSETFDGQFIEAMDFAEIVFSRIFISAKALMQQKKEILETYASLEDRRYLIDQKHRPVLAFRDEMPELLFYVFPKNDPDGFWNIKCASDGEFNNRKNLPMEWAGKHDKELEEVSGIKDMLFCHNSLFICGAKNKEAILVALKKALNY